MTKAAIVALAAVLSACASTTTDGNASALDASGTPPDEPRIVTLTLWPFHEARITTKAYETSPLGGVRVCVARRRALRGTWSDFVTVNGPCTTSAEPDADGGSKPIVLEHVPGLAELIVTAEKDGYESAAFAATTGAYDESLPAIDLGGDNNFFTLFPIGGASSLYDPGVARDEGAGMLLVSTVVFVFERSGDAGAVPTIGYLGGVRISLDQHTGNGPYYELDGTWQRDAEATLLSDFEPTRHVAGAAFVNLPEGEYRVHLDQPNAFCNANGFVYGFAAGSNAIRAPVLAGHWTSIVAGCTCLGSTDATRCAPTRDASGP